MNPPPSGELRELFLRASSLPPERRRGFVQASCGDDQDLRRELESLLEFADTETNFFFEGTGEPGEGSRESDSAGPGTVLPRDSTMRFRRGDLLANRYRVLARLGRGGMGEVYRAEDQRLGQEVALKFLPAHWVGNQARMEAFYQEVRLARSVSHPSVCRVYDIQEFAGEPFLTMEFVDGMTLEDTLARNAGHPIPEARRWAAQLCEALLAVHANGVLHGDLKPANVLVDTQGDLHLTDFGIASDDGEREAGDATPTAGTPAYMAPEQLAGDPATVRSDLYALGLVLWEILYGEKAHAAEWSASEEEDEDPLRQQLHRLLSRNPKDRPEDGIGMFAALTGRDPLALAESLGTTPSPEILEASAEPRVLGRRGAFLCLVGVLLGVLFVAWANTHLVGRTVLGSMWTPGELRAQATSIVERMGMPGEPVHRAEGFAGPRLLPRSLGDEGFDAGWTLGAPDRVDGSYWFRASAEELLPIEPGAGFGGPLRTRFEDPPPLGGDGLRMLLSTEGELLYLDTTVSGGVLGEPRARLQGDEPGFDWDLLLAETGIDADRLAQTDAELEPPRFADQRIAWEVLPEIGGTPGGPAGDGRTRIEAAARNGVPVLFVVLHREGAVGPGDEVVDGGGTLDGDATALGSDGGSTGPDVDAASAIVEGGPELSFLIATWLFILMNLAAIGVAWRNTRLGRVNMRGATRLASLVLVISMLVWLFGATHARTLEGKIGRLLNEFGTSGTLAAMVWCWHLGLEPYVRRIRPRAMITWSRLMRGRFRDPFVGQSMLIGAAVGVVLAIVFVIEDTWLLDSEDSRFAGPGLGTLTDLLSARAFLSSLLIGPLSAVLTATRTLMYLVIARALVRREIPAIVLTFALLVGEGALYHPEPIWGVWTAGVVHGGLLLWVLVRYGMTAACTAYLVYDLLLAMPVVLDPSPWYARASLPVALGVIGLALHAYRLVPSQRRPETGLGLPVRTEEA